MNTMGSPAIPGIFFARLLGFSSKPKNEIAESVLLSEAWELRICNPGFSKEAANTAYTKQMVFPSLSRDLTPPVLNQAGR
jgi:hypothetical protein